MNGGDLEEIHTKVTPTCCHLIKRPQSKTTSMKHEPRKDPYHGLQSQYNSVVKSPIYSN